MASIVQQHFKCNIWKSILDKAHSSNYFISPVMLDMLHYVLFPNYKGRCLTPNAALFHGYAIDFQAFR